MWAAKLKAFDEGNIYTTKVIKHKVSMHYYPMNYYLEKNAYYFIALGFIEGLDKNVKDFFKDLKHDNKPSKNRRYVFNLEVKGNFFVCITAQSKNVESKKYVHLFYNPKLIHINPAIIHLDGWEEWSIASLKRKDIESIIRIGRENYNAKLLLLKETKLDNIATFSILPKLTEKQKTAFLLAVKNNYYEYPRKIELKKLAKLMKISLSTYQAHLRKAEKQLLPFIAKKYF